MSVIVSVETSPYPELTMNCSCQYCTVQSHLDLGGQVLLGDHTGLQLKLLTSSKMLLQGAAGMEDGGHVTILVYMPLRG